MAAELRAATIEIFTKMGDGTTGVEVGVHYGFNAVAMALVLRPKKIYCIDPWMNYVDPDSLEIIGEAQYQQTKRVIGHIPYIKERVEIIRKTSEEAVKQFEDKSLDWVYIDAQHTYGAVLQDLTMWFPKVRDGGIVSGHDFDETMAEVKSAVMVFCDIRKLKFDHGYQDWWIHK